MGRQAPADQTGLFEELCASGAISSEWQDAFRAVRWQLFVPDAVWIGKRSPVRPVVRQDDPAAWLELVHSDVPLYTQVDDGSTAPGQPGRYPTSSISQPSLVAMMLARTQLAEGQRVCEIGTGTGYNAALLAYRLGPENVTTIEIDPVVAEAPSGVSRGMWRSCGCASSASRSGGWPPSPRSAMTSSPARTPIPTG